VSPSRKYVNLIHVEDLAAICLLALGTGKPGEAYNVSDGQPRTWHEICATAQQRWGIIAAAANQNSSPGKRISNAKLREELGYTFRHPDLYDALTLIKSGGGARAQDGQNGFQQGPRR
jgi:nucleoside-diphosphate-sugar epimerase